MAQILKESVKEAIIVASKKEFLEKGYEKASMRHIALKAHMTVGNLYRYFDSKEAIHNYIVKDALFLIDDLLKRLTANKISFENSVDVSTIINTNLNQLFTSFTSSLADIYFKHKEEFKILMLEDSLISHKLYNWLNELIYGFIEYASKDKIDSEIIRILSLAYSSSIFEGFIEIFKNESFDLDKLKMILNLFFISYLNIFNDAINNYGGNYELY